ncbi:MAG: metallophosphoesterase [Clostridium sp.]
MLIAVVSDTHRMNKYINIAKDIIKDADIVIHLGDNSEDIEELTSNFNGEVYGVRGNCDGATPYPKEQLIEVEGKRIFFCHGDSYGVKYSLTTIYLKGREMNADVVLFGHTHEAMIEKQHGIILMNPGSIALPRLKGRYVGFIEIKNEKEIQCYLKDITKQ